MKKILALLLAFVLLSSLSCAAAMTPAGSLTYGDRGEEVLKIQQALAQLGYQVGKIDGSFGAYTENALRKFQKKNGLAVDGIAGARTRELLYEKANLASSPVQPIVVTPPATAVSTPSTSTGTAQASAVTSSDGSFFGGNYASIYPGQSGTRVVLLQNALLQLGYPVGRIDGKYGTNTKKAVSNFQRAQKLTVDGVAGKNTLRKMEGLKSGTQTASSSSSSVSIIPTAQSTANAGTTYKEGTLALGMTGSAVSTLQTQLKTLGYYASGIDGVFGSGTQAAVEAFQKASGLTADGVAGAKTQSGIAAALTRASTASTASTTATVTYRNLQTGSSGTDVSNLQTALKNLSYTVNVTGIYDAVTKAAVTLFQRQNKLTADGIAGVKTQTRLYSGSAAAAPAVTANTNNTGTAADTGTTSAAPTSSTVATADTGGPSRSSIKLLHWFNDIKPTLRTGQTILVYEPVSGISWTLRLYSLGRHADAEPLTADDTARMVKAFGGQNTWNQKAVYVRLPSGTWTLGSTHDMPHLSGAISNNNFDGHLCVHFLRTMSECEQNDPKYGVANQNTIRSAWKALTGETVN